MTVEGEELRPFRVGVPDSELADLRDRLDRARWAPEPRGGDQGYGVSLAFVQQLAAHWRDRYDWRAWESRINDHPQFTTIIDGTNVHFLHVRSPEPGPLPLVLSHGWPGSVAEYLDVIGPLSDPRRHGLDPGIAFDLVIPSLPGFGWSGPTPDVGWGPRRIARAWAVLMRRLGYRRYGAAGNDWGSFISPELGRIAPEEVAGVHVTQVFPAGPVRCATPPTVTCTPSSRRHWPTRWRCGAGPSPRPASAPTSRTRAGRGSPDRRRWRGPGHGRAGRSAAPSRPGTRRPNPASRG